MSLIKCLRKVGSFDADEQQFLLSKARELEATGLSPKEAEIAVVKQLQEEITANIKSVFNQLDIETTKEVTTSIAGDYTLKPMRIAYRKGGVTLEQEQYDALSKAEKEGYTEVIKPAQVILPWNVRGKDGRLLKIKNFLAEDGTIDTKLLPKEILTQFGFRIPNQGHNSMSLIEVVGFLPEVYNGIVIASRNFITQMGSDFDVDKLYIYNYYTEVDKDGKVVKQDNTKNRLLDIHKSVLYNPKVFNYVIRPVDLGELKYVKESGSVGGIAQELKQLYTKKQVNYLDPAYDRDKYIESVDGKSMVGINAVGLTFLSLTQGKSLYLRKRIYDDEGKAKWVSDQIVFSDAAGKRVVISNLSDPIAKNKQKKTDNKSAYLSASVDNEKDPILSYINHNPQTAAVEALLIAGGMGADLSLFTAQPVIREYVKRVRRSRSIVSEEFQRENAILATLLDDYKETIGKLGKRLELDLEGLADLPIGTIHFRQALYNTEPEKVLNLPPFTAEEIQALVLLKFDKAYRYGDVYSRAQGLLNIKNATKSMLELSDKRDKIDKITNPKDSIIGNLHQVIGEFDLIKDEQGVRRVLVPDTLTGHLLVNGIYAPDDTIKNSDLMPFSYPSFRDLFFEYEQILNRDLTAENKYAAWLAVKSYVFAGAFSVEERERIFFDRGGNKSLNTRIHELLKTKLKNNPFLLRLDLSKVNVDGKLPSLVQYNAAKEEDIEETEIYQGLLDLVFSNDPEVKAIGVDLIKYFYINGGNQGSKEWGRYMSPQMLAEVTTRKGNNLIEFVQNVSLRDYNQLGSVEEAHRHDMYISASLLQMFQHKPYLAPKLVTKLSKEQLVEDRGEIHFAEGSLPKELERGTKAVVVFSRKDEKGATHLYNLLTRDAEGNYIYLDVSRLGGIHYSEYQQETIDHPLAGELKLRAVTLIGKEKVKPKVESLAAQTAKIDPTKPSKETITNPLLTEEISPLVNTTLEESLKNISSDKYHIALRDLFDQLDNILDGVTVEAIQDNSNFFGRWSPDKEKGGKITINLQKLAESKMLTKKKVEEIILKEVIHVINAQLFRRGFNPTPQQEAAKKAIEILFEGLRDRVAAGDFESIGWKKDEWIQYQTLLEKYRKKEQLTEAEIDFLAINKTKYYGLTNVEDFMHDALLEPEFRDMLNKVKYSANGSLLDRIGNLIAKILDSFRKLVNIREGSALEEAFAQIFKITNDKGKPGDTKGGDQLSIEYDLASENIQETERKGYTSIINAFEVRLARIARDISRAYAANDPELVANLKNRYDEVQEEKDYLLANNTFEAVTATAKNDLEYVEKLLRKDDLKLNEILYSEIILKTWASLDNTKIYSAITSFDVENTTKRFQDVTKIAAQARELDIKLDAIKVGRLKDFASKELNREVTEEELTQLTDIGHMQSQTRDISTSNNVILSIADKWMRKADFEAVGDMNVLNEKINTLTEAIQKTEAYKAGGFAGIFGQVTKDGELTGELVDALTYEYYRTRDKLLQAIDNAKTPLTRKDAAKKYYDWVRDNHIIVDIGKLYKVDVDGFFIWKGDADYLKALERELGEDLAKTVEKAKELVEKYNEDLKNQIAYFKGAEEGDLKLEQWKIGNSPLIYIDNLKNGLTSRRVGGKYIKNAGWKYISKRVIASWEDPKYNAIQKDPTLKEYYDFYRTTLKELYQYLPYNLRKEFKPTEIPNINKDLIEELTQVGIGKSWNRIWSKFLENISVTNEDPAKTINPVTKDFQKDFKFSYLNKINPESKSYDLTKVLKLFASQSIGYKYKAQVEDAIRLSDSILREAVEKKIKPGGEIAKDKYGSITTTKGLENLLKQFDYAFDAFLGNKKEQREGVTDIKILTPKAKEELQKDIDAINADPKLNEDEKKAQIALAREKYYRRFSWGRAGDQLLQWVQLKGMGWNVFAGVNNALFGQMANFNWAAGGVDFDDKEMMKALQVMLSFDGDTEKKVRALMTKFNTVKQLRDFVHKSTSNYNKAMKGIEKAHPFALYAKGEYFIQGQVMVALLEHQKVEVTENGQKKTISLFEAFDVNGEWNTARFGENPEWAKGSQKTYDFKNKLDNLLKKIHGNYDPNAAMLANKKFIGRALLQFRRWIPEGVAQRFDSEKYDIYLQRNTKGRYITYGDLGFRKSIRVLADMIMQKGDKAFEGITNDAEKLEIIKENMRKNLREIYYKISLIGIALALGLDDDDNTMTKSAKNYWLNTAIRLQDDIAFFYSPMATENITRSFIPATAVILDSYNFLHAMSDTFQGEGTYETGNRAGDKKLFWTGMRMIPLGTAATSLMNKIESADTRARRK